MASPELAAAAAPLPPWPARSSAEAAPAAAAAVAASAPLTLSGDDAPVVVVGAGLAGSMMALMLVRRGFRVELYEKRPDFRAEEREEAERDR